MNTESQTEALPRPICFMVTPFGVKEAPLGSGGPGKINFDILWAQLFEPMIRALGYEPVRADADLGASIVGDMIERLALSDLVIADVSLPNPNVFYEVGVRHAACATGCVLVAATWSKQPFDTQSMRREPYELAAADMTDEEVRRNRASLEPRIVKLSQSKTPCFELPGFPKLPLERAQSFRSWLLKMSEVNTNLAAVRLESNQDVQKAKAQSLVARYLPVAQTSQVIAFELLMLVRDVLGWSELLTFLGTLPAALQNMPVFVEQRCLALSKSGDHTTAIAALDELIRLAGPTPERHGLRGGRYKKLWREVRSTDARRAAAYLNSAIEAYEAGRVLDLNAYYTACNLPLLLKSRGEADDVVCAERIAISVVMACERAIALGTADEWVYPTLLVAAFHAAESKKAAELTRKVLNAPSDWKLSSTLDDLTDAVELQTPGAVREALAGLVAKLHPPARL